MISWVKRNKLASLLIVILLFVLLRSKYGVSSLFLTSTSRNYSSPAYESAGIAMDKVAVAPMALSGTRSYQPDYAPAQTTDRLVIQESNLSLKVSAVRESVDKIIDQAKTAGGYMVSSSLSSPEEAPFASVVIRIPAEKLKESLAYYRSLAVKVTSENLLGTDVTDEYVDIDARLITLNKTKAKFEEIMNQAVRVDDLLQVQRELINLQDQIDSLKGRQNYLEKTAEMAKITMYLSTDEYALPYAPATPFRPSAIFKEAVRSLVVTLRGIATIGIRLGVYSVIWLPIVVVIYFIRRRAKNKLT